MTVALIHYRSLDLFVIFRTIPLPLLGLVFQLPPIKKACSQCQPYINHIAVKVWLVIVPYLQPVMALLVEHEAAFHHHG
jgi:hypothetical protein